MFRPLRKIVPRTRLPSQNLVPGWQKLRHGGLPPGQLFGTLLRVKNASEGEAGTRIGGQRNQRLLPQPPGR